MKRILRISLYITAIIVSLLAVPTPTHAAVAFDVVMVGDSIGNIVFPHVTATGDIHWDAEGGRAPYNTGNQDRATMVQAFATLGRTLPANENAYLVVIDGGMADKDGVYVDNAEWTAFVNDIIYWSQNRCLIFVYPGYDHIINGVPNETPNDTMYARTQIAAGLINTAKASGQCIHTVNWWYAADQNPNYTQADGLHPSTAGRNWLAGQISGLLP